MVNRLVPAPLLGLVDLTRETPSYPLNAHVEFWGTRAPMRPVIDLHEVPPNPMLIAHADRIRAEAFKTRCQGLAEFVHPLSPYVLVVVGLGVLATSHADAASAHAAIGGLMTGGGSCVGFGHWRSRTAQRLRRKRGR